MKRLFWIDGRFSWWFIAVVAYVTVSLLALDYAWRVVSMSTDTLIVYAILIDGALAILLIGIFTAFRRSRRSH